MNPGESFRGLTLVFENTDSIFLSPSFIAQFELRGVKEIITYSSISQDLTRLKEAERFYLRLKVNAATLPLKNSLIPLGDWLSHFNDITEVEILAESERIERVILPWKEEEKDDNNPHQKRLFGQDGQITIMVDSETCPFVKEVHR